MDGGRNTSDSEFSSCRRAERSPLLSWSDQDVRSARCNMARFETAHLTESYRKHCEDRVAVIPYEERTIIIVADGAGGIGNGDLAAEAVIREVRNDHLNITTGDGWEAELRQIDCRICVGESTAVVVDL